MNLSGLSDTKLLIAIILKRWKPDPSDQESSALYWEAFSRVNRDNEPSTSKTRSKRLTDEEWWEGLKKIYRGVDLDAEKRKAEAWLLRHSGRRFTRKFFDNWLSKKDGDISVQAPSATTSEGHFGKEIGIQ